MDLVSALELAASAKQDQRQRGDAALSEIRKLPQFHLKLFEIYSNAQTPFSARYLALIYLKNRVESEWRKFSVFSKEEKESLRGAVLPMVVDPLTLESAQMARQLAVIIAAISRSDFPRAWPELLDTLRNMALEQANVGNIVALSAILEATRQTTKRLATVRIGLGRTQFVDFAVSSVALYWQFFKTFASYTALKIVGTLLYDGHDRGHRFEQPQQVFSELMMALQSCQDSKIIACIGKIYARLVDKQPLMFCGFGQSSFEVMEFYTGMLVARANEGPVVQAMLLVRDLTRIAASRSRQEFNLPLNLRPRDDNDREELQAAFSLVMSAFPSDRVSHIVSSLLEFYFQMSPDDVELWRDDPEEFVLEEQRQSPEYNVQLCSEMLFAHFIRAWPESVGPQAQGLVENAVKSESELHVEGALRALQFGAETFAQSFSIEPAVHHLSRATSPLIRRRLCLVLGGWIPVKNSAELQGLAFELVQDVLRGSWDIVVQLGALELVRIACDDLDFLPDLFQPVSELVFATCYKLLQNQSDTEVKIRVLAVLSAVIEGLGPRLSDDNITKILTILPALWEAETEHSNHHLVQGAVLQTLSNLVSAAGAAKSAQSYHVTIPLVEVATDPQQPLATYLMDDALAVWKSLLVNAPTAEELGSLFGRAIVLLETRTEYMSALLSIIESYFWLDHTLAMPYYTKLFGLFALYLGDGCAINEALLILLCLEVLMSRADGHKESEAMIETGLMQWIEMRIRQSGDDQALMDIAIQASKCLNVVSLISIKTQGSGVPGGPALCPIWLSKVRSIGDPRDRKLVCMGATALLIGHPDLFNEYSKLYIDTWVMVIDEIPDTAPFTLFYGSSDDSMSAEESRQHAVRQQEAVVVVGMQAFVRDIAEHARQLGNPYIWELAQGAGVI